MYIYRDKVALITGASSGIGEALARALARRRMNLILVARSEDKLRKLAAELVATYRIRAEVLAVDLSCEGAAAEVLAETARLGMPVDMLVNNAGVASFGQFDQVSPARDHRQVLLNVAAVTDLCHAFIPGMLARGSGTIVNLSSIVAFWPLPFQSVYGASKAYVLSLSRALAAEYGGKGIHVLAVCPGPTATNYFEAADAHELEKWSGLLGNMRRPEQVALSIIKGLESGKSLVVDGLNNRLFTALLRVCPPMLLARATARVLRPKDTAARHGQPVTADRSAQRT